MRNAEAVLKGKLIFPWWLFLCRTHILLPLAQTLESNGIYLHLLLLPTSNCFSSPSYLLTWPLKKQSWAPHTVVICRRLFKLASVLHLIKSLCFSGQQRRHSWNYCDFYWTETVQYENSYRVRGAVHPWALDTFSQLPFPSGHSQRKDSTVESRSGVSPLTSIVLPLPLTMVTLTSFSSLHTISSLEIFG